MELGNLARPRFVLATVSVLVVGGLMHYETIEPSVGILVILGILSAFEAYDGVTNLGQ